jgi:uncharacterized damage-inducible protein DinB
MNVNDLERSTIPDLFAHHRWAMAKIFEKCSSLADADLDRAETLGPGSLRATLVHMLGAERIWLARWRGTSPTEFPPERDTTVLGLQRAFREVDAEREKLIESESANGCTRVADYLTFAGLPCAEPLYGLLLHVANHAVHHRAQVLQYLRLAGVKIPGGLDYVFFRIAQPTVEIPQAVADACRGYGLEVGVGCTTPRRFDPKLVRMYSHYVDWAMARIFGLAQSVDDEGLDREFPMGMGSLRKTLLHILDAERFWRSNWRGETDAFPKSPANTSLADMTSQWEETAAARNRSLEGWSADELDRVVHANFGAGLMPLRVGESALQLCVHGTHHRAQAVNMLRRLGHTPPSFDLVVWIRETQKS